MKTTMSFESDSVAGLSAEINKFCSKAGFEIVYLTVLVFNGKKYETIAILKKL